MYTTRTISNVFVKKNGQENFVSTKMIIIKVGFVDISVNRLYNFIYSSMYMYTCYIYRFEVGDHWSRCWIRYNLCAHVVHCMCDGCKVMYSYNIDVLTFVGVI